MAESLGKVRFRTIQAWASNASGDDFTLTFDSALAFTAFINTNQDEEYTPVVGDFAGAWQRWKPQVMTLESISNGVTLTLEDYDPEEDDTVETIYNGSGQNAEPTVWSTTWNFDANAIYEQDIDSNITISINPVNISNNKIIWGFDFADPNTLTLPSEFVPRNGSVLPGGLTNGETYIMEAEAYKIGETTYVLYEITQVS